MIFRLPHPRLGLGLLMFLAAAAVLRSAPPSWDAWQQVQEITVAEPAGLVRLDLPSATFAAAQPRLRDLRLADRDGAEMPFHLARPNTDQVWLDPVEGFHTALQDGSTVIGIENNGVHALRSVVLETPAAAFLKGATVEASQDGAVWQSLVRGEVIFREADGAARLRIPVPSGTWKLLRVIVDDRWSKSVPFTAASLERHQPATPQVPETVTLLKREELPGSTRLTLRLQTPCATLGVLRLQTPEPLFHRKITVAEPSGPHVTSLQTLAVATAFRLNWEGQERSSLEIPVHREVGSAEIFLTIENGSSPPLEVEGVTGTRYPVSLLFQAKPPGPWRLYSGNPLAPAPWYDLAGMDSSLKAAPATAAVAGPLMLNPAYRKEAGLPALGESGGLLDPANWRRRKAVTLPGPGVHSLELDLETMARSTGRDLRLVQEGRQIPYVRHPSSKTRQLPVAFTPDPDPRRPRMSRWRIDMPLEHTPVKDLLLRAATPVFQRSLRLLETTEHGDGRGPELELGAAEWTQRPGQAGHALTFHVPRPPAGRTLWLETDNGDNAPLELQSVMLVHDVSELRFQTGTAAPVFLYYDQPEASEPRYDLRLVAQDLASAIPSTATLGPEVLLTSVVAGDETGKHQGNFWLWSALTLMTAGLLWLVVRLLPEQPEEKP